MLTQEELARLAEICLRHKITICSDEIHSDLLLNDQPHIPIAALSPEMARHSITLIAPSKTYNLPGLGCSVAIIPDKDRRREFENYARSLGVHVNLMGYEAATAAYEHGDPWLKQVLAYCRANRDFMVEYIHDHIPALKTTVPEATYLAWLDCRDLPIPTSLNAYEFFLKEARVALSPGTFFGSGYDAFVRLNFACPRSLLAEALERLKAAVDRL
jgi:cystathionine beta-lyase